MLTPITNAFQSLLNFLGAALAAFYQVIPNYGVAIILLTIGTRLVLLPLTIKQTRSMQEMQRIQPELKKLQAKYKGGDKAKMNEEMMKLYKEHHVNPLGGCLPLLLQLPIFLALYRVLDACGKNKPHSKACLSHYVGLGHIPKGTSLYSALLHGHNHFLGINLGLTPVNILHNGLVEALPAFVLVLLMVATTWYQQKQIMGVSSGQQADQMKLMGQIMPLLLGVFSLELASGISVYWVASNIWTVGQQAVVLKKPVGDLPTGGADGGKKALPAAPKAGGPKGLAAGSGKAAGAGKSGAGGKSAAARTGTKEPQTAGAGAKVGAKAGNVGKATVGKGGTPARNAGANGAGKAASNGGSGGGGGASGKGGQKPAPKAPVKPVAKAAPKAAATPAGGSGGSSGSGKVASVPGSAAAKENAVPSLEDAEAASEVEVEVGAPTPANGAPAPDGAVESGGGAESKASPEAGAPRPRPQRAQPSSASGGRKRRR